MCVCVLNVILASRFHPFSPPLFLHINFLPLIGKKKIPIAFFFFWWFDFFLFFSSERKELFKWTIDKKSQRVWNKSCVRAESPSRSHRPNNRVFLDSCLVPSSESHSKHLPFQTTLTMSKVALDKLLHTIQGMDIL